MTWIPWQWQFDASYRRPELSSAANERLDGRAPTPMEEWLVEVIYQTIVADSRCGECRARLRPRLQIRPVEGRPAAAWALTVESSCRGWRRHRHAALVIDTGRHLDLGPFAATIDQ
jgi:hypothetical protein